MGIQLRLTEIFRFLDNRNTLFWVIISIVLILFTGWLDFETGYELSFSLFYLAPISLAAWFVKNRYINTGIAAFSALVWLVADIGCGHEYSHDGITIWNTAIRLGFFIVVIILISSLRKVFDHEREMSRTDYLTGAFNMRSFMEIARNELNRIERYKHPFTIAYIDLDDFKDVNDGLGHSEGDSLLQLIAKSLKKYMRVTDVVARLGGDEFVLLLPETDQEAAKKVMGRLQGGLTEEIQKYNHPITFSIGVLTCTNGHSVEDLLKTADHLMYSVKNTGKNGIKYSQK